VERVSGASPYFLQQAWVPKPFIEKEEYLAGRIADNLPAFPAIDGNDKHLCGFYGEFKLALENVYGGSKNMATGLG